MSTPMLSDLELLSLSLTAKYLGIDSENDLFRKLPVNISSRERSVYNRRRGRLANHLDTIRIKLASHFNEYEDYFIIDSMPLEVCKLSRSSRSKICKDMDYAFADKCYCVAQDTIIMVRGYALLSAYLPIYLNLNQGHYYYQKQRLDC